MPDRNLTCGDCKIEFNFSAEEQDFYNERGFQEPKRCKECREKRKRERSGGSGGGHRFNR